MNPFRLDRGQAVIVVVDIQEKLAAVMEQRERVVRSTVSLLKLAELTGIPVLVTEQYPKGLGPTVPEIASLAGGDGGTIEKIAFSCCRCEGFPERLAAHGRRQVIITGMETHVCVLQTGLDLLDAGYQVFVPWDAVCSRLDENRVMGLSYLRDAGAAVTGTETVIFQVLGKAGTPEFKAMMPYVK